MTKHDQIDLPPSAVPADAPAYEERPWGAFWSLDRGAAHQVKASA